MAALLLGATLTSCTGKTLSPTAVSTNSPTAEAATENGEWRSSLSTEFTCGTDQLLEDGLALEPLAAAAGVAVEVDPLFRVAPLEKQVSRPVLEAALLLQGDPRENASTLSLSPELLERQRDYLDLLDSLKASGEELSVERREELKAEVVAQ